MNTINFVIFSSNLHVSEICLTKFQLQMIKIKWKSCSVHHTMTNISLVVLPVTTHSLQANECHWSLPSNYRFLFKVQSQAPKKFIKWGKISDKRFVRASHTLNHNFDLQPIHIKIIDMCRCIVDNEREQNNKPKKWLQIKLMT